MTDEEQAIDKLLKNEFNLRDKVMIASKYICDDKLTPAVIISVINYPTGDDTTRYDIVLESTLTNEFPTIARVIDTEVFPRTD